MKHRTKTLIALILAVLLILSACGKQADPPVVQTPETPQPLILTAVLGDAQDTLVPSYSTAAGSETILYHLYENLLRWEDDGNGYAVLAPGQAESYTVETDYAGNATYTFTLRNDIVWSDGQSVTSYQFAAAWQRLADPAYNSPHRELFSCIAGYDEVQATGDPSLLQVSTPDARTLVVKLVGSVPCFLEVVCAGAYTMPIRTYLPGNMDNQIVTNGAYYLAEFSDGLVKLAKSENYYDRANVTVDEIHIIPASDSETDYVKLSEGTIDFTGALPVSALQELAVGSWVSEPVTVTYALLLNTMQYPFDNADVRAAFRLAVDEQAIVNALADYTSRAATGLVPYGVNDHGVERASEEDEDQTASADPNVPAPEQEEKAPYADFRAHSREIVTMDISEDYDIDCTWARALLSGAGFADGKDFPQVEYIYVDTPENKLVAECLRSTWQNILGVTVTLRGLTEEEYAQMLQPSGEGAASGEETLYPAFQIAATELTCDYTDAYDFLARWHSASAENICGYSSPAFDILIGAAAAATAPESFDAYLHDAEAILLQDSPVIPLFYRGGSYALSDDLTGLYRAPNGIYFFSHITRSVEE